MSTEMMKLGVPNVLYEYSERSPPFADAAKQISWSVVGRDGKNSAHDLPKKSGFKFRKVRVRGVTR